MRQRRLAGLLLACLALWPHAALGGSTATLQIEMSAQPGLDVSHAWSTCGVAVAGGDEGACYLARYPDVAQLWGGTPWEHFVAYGQAEGRVWGCGPAAVVGANEVLQLADGTHGIQCVQRAGPVAALIGTSTVKAPGIEVLAWIICNGAVLWQGEHYQGTVPIALSGLTGLQLTGPCFMGAHLGGSLGFQRAVYEMQVTIFFQ